MKVLYSVLPLFIIIISFNSCEKSSENTDSYMIFGNYCGECGGDECVNIFKLTDSIVFEDQNNNYPGPFTAEEQFDFMELSTSKFDKVSSFIELFPTALLDDNADQYGCPDCYDQCGYYLEWKADGNTRTWTIDTNKNDIPEFLHEFVDQLEDNIALLQE